MRRGLVVQAEVIWALILRETRTRFGHHQLGYLWAMLEPVIMILTFYVVFQLAGHKAPFQMDLMGFITTGIIPYNLFASSLSRVAESVNGNRGLLFYPHVMPMDIVIARVLLELVTYISVFMVLMGGNALYNHGLEVAEPLNVLLGFTLASLLGATAGLIFCSIAVVSKLAERIRGPLLRPLFWISGIFFAADSFPASARQHMLRNPVLHTIELTRSGWYDTYGGSGADAGYVCMWILGLACVGLVLERVVRSRIELT